MLGEAHRDLNAFLRLDLKGPTIGNDYALLPHFHSRASGEQKP